MQPRTDDTVPSTTTSESTTPLPTRPVSTISPLSAPLTPRAALQPASTLSPYSCVVPAGFGLAFGSVTGFFVNFAAGDGLGGALRWGVGLATCGAARCLRMKARGGSEYDDPRQNYDRAIGYGIGAATVPLTGEIVDRVTRRATLAPIFVFRRTLMYSLLGVLVGGAMVSDSANHLWAVRLCGVSAVSGAHLSLRVVCWIVGLLPAGYAVTDGGCWQAASG